MVDRVPSLVRPRSRSLPLARTRKRTDLSLRRASPRAAHHPFCRKVSRIDFGFPVPAAAPSGPPAPRSSSWLSTARFEALELQVLRALEGQALGRFRSLRHTGLLSRSGAALYLLVRFPAKTFQP